MSGVIHSLAPETKLDDLTRVSHLQGAFGRHCYFKSSFLLFSTWQLSVIVVDPEVGTNRCPSAAKSKSQYKLESDNGLFPQLIKFGEVGAPIVEED
jgi:S-adenosylmethionine hydrolase